MFDSAMVLKHRHRTRRQTQTYKKNLRFLKVGLRPILSIFYFLMRRFTDTNREVIPPPSRPENPPGSHALKYASAGHRQRRGPRRHQDTASVPRVKRPAGATRRLHQLPKSSRYPVTGTEGGGHQVVRLFEIAGARIMDVQQRDERRLLRKSPSCITVRSLIISSPSRCRRTASPPQTCDKTAFFNRSILLKKAARRSKQAQI